VPNKNRSRPHVAVNRAVADPFHTFLMVSSPLRISNNRGPGQGAHHHRQMLAFAVQHGDIIAHMAVGTAAPAPRRFFGCSQTWQHIKRRISGTPNPHPAPAPDAARSTAPCR